MPVPHGAIFDRPNQLLAKQVCLVCVTSLIGLFPEAVHAHTQGLFHDLCPTIFIVDDLGEQSHRFNGPFAGRMGIPPLACQVLARAGLTRKQGHGEHKVDMKAGLPGFGLWFFMVEDKQAVELVGRQAGGYHRLEAFNDFENLCPSWLLIGPKGQTPAGVLVCAADAVDEVNG